jgi:hypothetical protein
MMDSMETEKLAVVVVSIPEGLSAADVQELVNVPVQDGSYYFAGVTPYQPGALAFFRLRAEKVEKAEKPKTPKEVEPIVDEDKAVAILEANRRMTCQKLVALLEAKGVKRGRQWVYLRRAERGY